MGFYIVHDSIVHMRTDAVVNAANSFLEQGGGVCGAIFKAAGADKLREECRKKAPCPVGQAVVTGGYGLKAKYIIHTVGPVWKGGTENEREYLENAYHSALQAAESCGCQSIAFPLISSGIYGYPKKEALEVAVKECREFLKSHEMEIYLAVLDRTAVELSEDLYGKIQHYMDSYCTGNPQRRNTEDISFRQVFQGVSASLPDVSLEKSPKVGARGIRRSLEQLLKRRGETFQEMLFRLIDEKGFTDVQVYKRANMDRKLFSKIRSNKEYTPKKSTVLSLAVALQLSLDETADLLGKTGYSMTDHLKSDIILRYFLENEIYDIDQINEALFCFGQPLLGM